MDYSLTVGYAGYNNTSTLNYSYGLIEQQQVIVTVIEMETLSESWLLQYYLSAMQINFLIIILPVHIGQFLKRSI